MKRTLLFFACALTVGLSTASVIKAKAKAAKGVCCGLNNRYCTAGGIVSYGPYTTSRICLD